MLLAALDELKSINKKDIVELKSMQNPPAGVRLVMESVCVMLNKHPACLDDRKATMAELADAFIALPGGFGTLEETLEMITWQQLGYHDKPVGLLNVGGFYDGLLGFFDSCVAKGFIRPASRAIVLSSPDGGVLLDRLAAYHAPESVVSLAMRGALDERRG